MALVHTDPQQNKGSGLAQEGVIDWVALGRVGWLDMFKRLSSAGVAAITVAVGRKMCSSIPLGTHGQNFLAEEMSKLRVCSSFGEWVWLGVGVRHILPTLVQTAEGASLVALCAALSEGYNVSTSALILFEMAKRFDLKSDETPSFKQWEGLVKVCSSVFIKSMLGHRIHQLLRIGGYNRAVRPDQASHPQDMAEVLLAVAKVATRDLEEISISGGSGCSLVAVFADQILGLKVSVRSDEGAMLWRNYDGSVDQGQISLQFCNRESPEAIKCVGQKFYLRHGNEFIKKCFLGPEGFHSATMESAPFLGGRVPWDSMFSETFGRDFEDLHHLLDERSQYGEFSARADIFERLFITGAAFFVFHTAEACRYRNITDFVLSAMDFIPELQSWKQKLLDPAFQCRFSAMSLDELSSEYEQSRSILARVGFASNEQNQSRIYCLAKITDTMIIMSYLFGRLDLEDPILPKRSGILSIYWNTPIPADVDITPIPSDAEFFDSHGSDALRALLYPEEDQQSLSFQLRKYVSIFSGEPAQLLIVGSTSAISDGRVYCFIDTLQRLSDSYAQASRIHVGAGSIQSGHRLHDHVFDPDSPGEVHSTVYRARDMRRVQKDLCPFNEDFTSPDLSINAVVEETARLTFCYHTSSRLGAIPISPASFVHIGLRNAVTFKTGSYPKIRKPGNRDGILDHNEDFSVIYGEGRPHQDCSTRFILRPHHGNVLGRCIALVTSSRPVALLGYDSDFSQFMKFWNHETKINPQPHYTLIS